MNKKGFTLVELLGVIIILTVILYLVFPIVTGIISGSKDTVYQKKINEILNGAYDWALSNPVVLPKTNESIYITLGELKNQNFVDVNIKDPTTDDYFKDDLVIKITNTRKAASNKYEKNGGDYLFTLNVNVPSFGEYLTNKPSIILNNLTADSLGNYIIKVDIGNQFETIDYEATSSTGKNLTSKVIVNITKNGVAVERIDTTKFGIYYINYTVVDYSGYSNTVTLSVIVTDEELPSLTVPENVTLSITDMSYDLLEGASCTDNSGKCTIKIVGEVEYGVKGKYIIEYRATDPSANVSTKNRVITIE